MPGVSARTMRSSSDGRARRVEAALGRVDLLGVGDALLRLVGRSSSAPASAWSKRLDQQRRPERGEPLAKRAARVVAAGSARRG